METIDIALWDIFSAHGEDVAHATDGGFVPGSPLIWPKPGVSLDNWREVQTVVAKADGLVVGRAVLGAAHYPFAELENLQVDPAFRGRGLGSRIVSYAIKRSSEMGYLALHLQTDLDNVPAHRLYAKHGFLPAQQGERLRMMRFLNYSALTRFLAARPLAAFNSDPGEVRERRLWNLSWRDMVSSDGLSILLSGGSCQGDSDGLGPAVAEFSLTTGNTKLRVGMDGPEEVSTERDFELELAIDNSGPEKIEGACRLLLNPGFLPSHDDKGSAVFSVSPESHTQIHLPIRLSASFDDSLSKISSYPSVPVTVEFFVKDQVFWLAKQVKVAPRG